MQYISTRSNHAPVSSAQAINLGMVPDGGLFIPEAIPSVEFRDRNKNLYQQTASQILKPLLTDFTDKEIDECIAKAYNSSSFDCPAVVNMFDLGANRSILELWHGPTAAFKDMALQIMPHFMHFSKNKIKNDFHTVILVATSGDTGKAALEGFKDCEGISIIVFYPFGGVSEIQRLQMETTGGKNTHVVAVRGNFDDCQTGVKQLFSDISLRSSLQNRGYEFSSANSINWGRLCPQIIYYFQAYYTLVSRSKISEGEKIDFCVPTGNFGNILAGYYARMMGLPIRKLICASNRNNVLADFFETGKYNRNRPFYKTNSPSMDILISSNLERFLFEIIKNEKLTRNDMKASIEHFYSMLSDTGEFSVGDTIKKSFDSFIEAGWVDEATIHSTISSVFKKTGYVIDTHTAVAAALLDIKGTPDVHTVITSTASPYKFSCDVLKGIEGSFPDDEFAAVAKLSALSNTPVHRAVDGLRDRAVHHNRLIDTTQMKDTVIEIVNSI
jgi:threonine synthase